MKITKIYVAAFGKLKNYTLDAKDGVVQINHENGWGKSTLSTFIKCIFYGLGAMGRDAEKSERRHYKPWRSNELFGGYIEFSWKENEYRIERYFGNKQSEDTVKIIDLKTGKEHSNTDNLGERIFDINEEGFLSTAYYSQGDNEIKNNASLATKYSDDFSAEDSAVFDKAVAKLEAKIKEYKLRGDKGLIADTRLELNLAQDEYDRLKVTDSLVSGLKGKIEDGEKNLEERKKKLTSLSEKIADAGKIDGIKYKRERLDGIGKEVEDLKTRKQNAERFFGGYYPTETEMSGYAERYKRGLELTAAERAAIQAVVETPKTENKKSSLPIIFMVLAAIFGVALLVCALAVKVLPLIIAFSICLLVCAVVGWIAYKKQSRVRVESEDFKNKQATLESIRRERIQNENAINGFLARFGLENTDILTAIPIINAKLNEVKSLSEALEVKKSLYEKYAVDPDLKDGETYEDIDKASLQREFDRENYEFREVANELAADRAKLVRYEENSEKLSDIESRISELKEKLKEYTHDFEIASKTLEMLKNAGEKLKSTYRAPLENALNKYLGLIAGKSLSAKIDLELKVSIEEDGALVDSGYYSTGYKNLFDICKRFALIEVLFKNEKPFVILDDPFYNLDDDKVECGKKLLLELGKEYQIFYLVCHKSRAI